MSQQRPDRIKQMLHYLWQHRHLSTQQAMELFWLCGSDCPS